MKKKSIANEFNITVNNQEYIIDIRETDKLKIMPDCSIYTCMTFTSDMVPVKRFNIVYNFHDHNYWAWTMNTINESDRTFREQIAELLNNGILKLAA
jgi:hypothetical protein